jgi:hypothetical protein
MAPGPGTVALVFVVGQLGDRGGGSNLIARE